jgi:hypothetical protein
VRRPRLSAGIEPGPYARPYTHAGSLLVKRRGVWSWYLAILTLARRIGIDKGHTPEIVEQDLGRAEGGFVDVVRLFCTRVLGFPMPMLADDEGGQLEVDDLRRIAEHMAARVSTQHPARFEWYPEGWRRTLRFVAGHDDEPIPKPTSPAREPGDDSDEEGDPDAVAD